jgi:hypothetical protein
MFQHQMIDLDGWIDLTVVAFYLSDPLPAKMAYWTPLTVVHDAFLPLTF